MSAVQRSPSPSRPSPFRPHPPAPLANGSVSPSAESLATALLPPPPPSRPRASSSTLSLHHPPAPHSTPVPPLPPPPRPLSTPSLSTLVSVAPSLSSPQLWKGCGQQRDGEDLLRKYQPPRAGGGQPHKMPPGGDQGGAPKDKRLTSQGSADANHPHHPQHDGPDTDDELARVRFLQKEDGGRARMAPLSRRERRLAAAVCLLLVACLAFLIIAFTRDPSYAALSSKYCISSTCVRTAAQLLAGMDRTVDPCTDFYHYACGTWDRRHAIPEDKHSYNTFEKLHDELQIVLRNLLEQEAGPGDSNATIKAKVFYRSCLNTTQIERVGDVPLREVTRGLGGWPILQPAWHAASFALEPLLADIRRHYDENILVGCYIAADDKNSSYHIIQLDQPRLGMDREYYLKAKSDSEFVQAYLNFMRGVVSLMGAAHSDPDVESQLADLIKFETKLANVTRPTADLPDTSSIYMKMTIATLQQRVPQFDWLWYLRRAVSPSLTSQEEVVVFAVDYLHDMMTIVTQTDSRTVANYLIWRVVMTLVPELTEQYQAVNNQYKMVFHGVKGSKLRWRKCVHKTNKHLGLAVGAMFIRDNFPRHSKETALEMIQDIRNAFNELLQENDWMDQPTKSVATQKANAMNARIGYPDFITQPRLLDKTYEGLPVAEQQYFQNVLSIKRFEAETKLSRLGTPVQKDHWDQKPAEINAFYSTHSNDIFFPAGILQPSFYSEHFPKSLNYGGIGVVIGHEITHGFDDRGRQYDLDGNLVQWWDNATITAFTRRTQCMVDQYSSFTLDQIGRNINGKNTRGENIADNGGLKQAYRAYRRWVEKHGEEPLLPGIGLTHDQLFFLNYAQIWCGRMRDEEALHTVRTSIHSPFPIRVLGPLSNSLDFARAFSCPKGSRMNPVHKCSVW